MTDPEIANPETATDRDSEQSEKPGAGAKTVRHTEAALPEGVGLFVDGPNVLREEFDVDLAAVRAAAIEAGGTERVVSARLYLDENASPGLIRAAEANGFRVVVTSGDVDVRLAVDATRFAAEGRGETLAIASRDTDFRPVVETAGEYGLATVAIAPGTHGRSDALRSATDRDVTLDG